MDLSQKDGGLPPDTVVQTTSEIIKDSQRLIERYHDVSEGSMRQIALAPCSPFSVSEDLMKESQQLARGFGVRLHTHLQKRGMKECYMMDKRGMRPLEYMEKLDWLGSDVWFAHGIHFNDQGTGIVKINGYRDCTLSDFKHEIILRGCPDSRDAPSGNPGWPCS